MRAVHGSVSLHPNLQFSDLHGDESVRNREQGDSKSALSTCLKPDSPGNSASLAKLLTEKRVKSKRRCDLAPYGASCKKPITTTGLYKDTYREIYNKTLKGLSQVDASTKEEPLASSQVGATVWSPEEKGVFFSSLGRRSKHSLRGIAFDICSKSEFEVFIYLTLLQRAATDQQYLGRRNVLPAISEFAAATEISSDCSKSIDLAADAFMNLQQRLEEKVEKVQRGGLSLLNARIAAWTERRLNQGAEGDNEVSRVLPAAGLLNLGTFLTLSKNLFMNSTMEEKNWRTYTRRGKPPSLMSSAFWDFCVLAVSITKRLVQSSLFFTMSRLRAMNASGQYTHGRHVRQQDVLAILQVLNMKRNAKLFWVGMARRCRLRVHERIRHRQVFGRRLTYDAVESMLSGAALESRVRTDIDDLHKAMTLSQESDSSYTDTADAPDVFGPLPYTPSDNDSSIRTSEGAEPLELSPGRGYKQFRQEIILEQAKDAYAHGLDLQAGREEKDLWPALDGNPAKKIESEGICPLKIPRPERKIGEKLTDWKPWANYVASWQLHEAPIDERQFKENRSFGKSRYLAPRKTAPNSNTSEIDHVCSTAQGVGSIPVHSSKRLASGESSSSPLIRHTPQNVSVDGTWEDTKSSE